MRRDQIKCVSDSISHAVDYAGFLMGKYPVASLLGVVSADDDAQDLLQELAKTGDVLVPCSRSFGDGRAVTVRFRQAYANGLMESTSKKLGVPK